MEENTDEGGQESKVVLTWAWAMLLLCLLMVTQVIPAFLAPMLVPPMFVVLFAYCLVRVLQYRSEVIAQTGAPRPEDSSYYP